VFPAQLETADEEVTVPIRGRHGRRQPNTVTCYFTAGCRMRTSRKLQCSYIQAPIFNWANI